MHQTLPLPLYNQTHHLLPSLPTFSTTATMNDATSNWPHSFHLPHPFIATSIPADSTSVTTTPPAFTAAAAAAGDGPLRSAGKAPPRKRSRASRRAPTTLLNTDTANFRAMVQQFTGVPTGPYNNTDGFGFRFGSENTTRQPPAGMPQQQRQYYEYMPPQQPQQEDGMHMGYGVMGSGMDDGHVMPGFFVDGMGHGYSFNG